MKINYDETFESADGSVFSHQRVVIGKNKLPMRSADGERYITEDVPVTMRDVLVGASNVVAGPEMGPMDIARVGGAGIAAAKRLDMQEDQLSALLERIPLSIRVPFFCTVVTDRIKEILAEKVEVYPKPKVGRSVKTKKK
jgi:hypothetical protein